MSYVSGFNLSIEEPENYPCDVISFRYMIIRRDSVIFNFIACNNGSLFPDEVMSQNKQIKSKDIIIINDIEYMCDVNHKKNKPVLILHIE
jgi:hypothetical protein